MIFDKSFGANQFANIYCPKLGFSTHPHILGPQTSEVVEVTDQDLRQGSTVNRLGEILKDTTDTAICLKHDESAFFLMVKESLDKGMIYHVKWRLLWGSITF